MYATNTASVPVSIPLGFQGNGNGSFLGANGIGDLAALIIVAGLFGWGGYGNGGWGGFGGGQSTSVYEGYVLNNDFSQLSKQISDTYNMTDRKFEGLANGMCSMGYETQGLINGVNTNIMQGTNTLQAAVKDCCCQTQQNIADVKYTIGSAHADTNYAIATNANMLDRGIADGFCQTNFNAERNTRSIVDSQTANTQAILAKLDAMENSRKDEKIAELTAKLNRADFAASQAAQNEYLVNRLDPHPCPISAYVVQPPQQVSFATNCNGMATFANGCGCNQFYNGTTIA